MPGVGCRRGRGRARGVRRTLVGTHYDTLQVSRTASQAVIRASYKALIQAYHPDRYEPKEEAERVTKQLNEAYAVLGDASRRAEYDAQLDATSASAAEASRSNTHAPPPSDPPPAPTSVEARSQSTRWWNWWFWAACISAFLAMKIIGLVGILIVVSVAAVWQWKRNLQPSARIAYASITAVLGVVVWSGLAFIATDVQKDLNPKSLSATASSDDQTQQPSPPLGYPCANGTRYNELAQLCEPIATAAPAVDAAAQAEWDAAIDAWKARNADFLSDPHRQAVMEAHLIANDRQDLSNADLIAVAERAAFAETQYRQWQPAPVTVPEPAVHRGNAAAVYDIPSDQYTSRPEAPRVINVPSRDYGSPARLPTWSEMKEGGRQ